MSPARITSRSGGQGLVEFALILPIFVLLVMALVDFGRAVYAWSAVSNAARDGARMAIVNQNVTGGVINAATEAAQQATALGLNPADTNQVRVEYLTEDLSATCAARAIGCVAEVRVQYMWTAITPVLSNFLGTITLSSTTRIPIEFTNP